MSTPREMLLTDPLTAAEVDAANRVLALYGCAPAALPVQVGEVLASMKGMEMNRALRLMKDLQAAWDKAAQP